MTTAADPVLTGRRGARDYVSFAPYVFTGIAFALLFAQPMVLLARDWWSDPEAGHGLLLAPISLWLAWRSGLRKERAPNLVLGILLITGAVGLRYLSGLAAELFTMRISMILGLAGIITFFWGFRQVLHWWLPFALFSLSIPIPAVLTNALAFPLQFKASAMGAALLDFRHVPVKLMGNVILLPGRQLFVTEACSGLRSLTALLSLGVLVGGLWLRYPLSRALLIAITLPVAIVVNAFRVFLTGFLVYYVSPEMGEGFMHMSEGWLLFVVAFVILGLVTWGVSFIERKLNRIKVATNE
ncbi:MAG: exosortase/archaeosortase family protein [Gemmatimonadota bacterium]